MTLNVLLCADLSLINYLLARSLRLLTTPVSTCHLLSVVTCHLLHLLHVTNHLILPVIRFHLVLVLDSAPMEDTLGHTQTPISSVNTALLRFLPIQANFVPTRDTSFPCCHIPDIKAGSQSVTVYLGRAVV